MMCFPLPNTQCIEYIVKPLTLTAIFLMARSPFPRSQTVLPTQLGALFRQHHFTRPEDAMGFWIWRLAHSYQRIFDRAVAELGVTHLQFVVLAVTGWLVGEAQAGSDDVTQLAVAQLSGIHFAQVSALAKSLEEKGLLARTRGRTDARRQVLSLTKAGYRLLEQALPVAGNLQNQLFGGRSQQSNLKDQLRALLHNWEGKPGLEASLPPT
jgi:DNA-binding MarR family transcriptional regulator